MKSKTVVIALVVIAIVSTAAYYFGVVIQTRAQKPTAQSVSRSYEAVFLTNGQVYFGKVAKRDRDEIVVRDIYYLRVEQQLQPAPENQTDQQPKIALVKLGDEIHGPQDIMRINTQHVLFTEKLKENGQVVQTILRHKQGATSQSSAQQSPVE